MQLILSIFSFYKLKKEFSFIPKINFLLLQNADALTLSTLRQISRNGGTKPKKYPLLLLFSHTICFIFDPKQS